jgi:hypothetical protein
VNGSFIAALKALRHPEIDFFKRLLKAAVFLGSDGATASCALFKTSFKDKSSVRRLEIGLSFRFYFRRL